MEQQVGVKALLRDDREQFLLLQRSEAVYGTVHGHWDIPGGRIQPGTSLLDNLYREVREETGLDVTEEPQLLGAQDIISPQQDPPRHVVRLTYVATASGTPQLTEEHTEYRWVSFSTLRSEAKLDVYVAELIERHAEFLHTLLVE